jgi:glycosyltransferase involved in cell wall biosynthesis
VVVGRIDALFRGNAAQKITVFPMTAKRLLMIGTAPGGQGGVASVVDVYRRSGFFERLDVHYVSTHVGGGRFMKLTWALLGGTRIAALLLSGQVSLVHAHVSSHGSFKRKAVYLALARWLGVPTVFHLHSGGFKTFFDQDASPLLRRWIVHTLQQSTGLVALSESWALYLRSLAPGARVWVIPNPVELPNASALSEGEDGRLLFLGRASESKGIYDLLDAFAAVIQRHPAARLAIGGDGDLQRLRARIHALGLQHHVEVLGWVAGEQKLAQFARCQVFVLPSYHEGLPMGMLEAMALAKAVVVTPVGGVPEAVQDHAQGLMVQVGDVAGLEDALLELLAQPDLRQRLGLAARARVDERFSTVQVLTMIIRMYAELGLELPEGSS